MKNYYLLVLKPLGTEEELKDEFPADAVFYRDSSNLYVQMEVAIDYGDFYTTTGHYFEQVERVLSDSDYFYSLRKL